MSTARTDLGRAWSTSAASPVDFVSAPGARALGGTRDRSLVTPIRPRGATAAAPRPGLTGHALSARYRALLVASDALVVLLAVGAWIAVAAPALTTTSAAWSLWACAATAAGAWMLALTVLRTRDTRVLAVGAAEYKRVAHATALSFGLIAIVFTVALDDTPHLPFVVTLPIGLFGLLLERWLWRKWLSRAHRTGRSLSGAIVVGAQDDVEYVIRRIREAAGAAFSVVGAALETLDRRELDVDGVRVPVVGGPDAAADAVTALDADLVIVAGRPRGGNDFIKMLAWDLERTDAELVLSSQLVDVAGPRIHFRPVDGLPLIHVEIPRFEGGKHALKRGLDLLGALVGLILISPLLAAIAIAIRLDGPGTVLFRQQRIGRNGETFKMLKFRSMVPDAEQRRAELLAQNEGSGLLFKMKDDPRVTRIGRFLRAHSLDELPQLWNVLRGDMSLVGPRPPLPAEVDAYTSNVHRRLFIKPGLTGLWQVSGRSDLDWEESVRLDLYYVENWSLTGDLMLIWRTLRVVARPDGAY